MALSGRLMQVRLCMDHLMLVCAIADVPQPHQMVISIDLGVNTLIAATDGQKAILVSGCAAKATVRWHNKRLASIQKCQAKYTNRVQRVDQVCDDLLLWGCQLNAVAAAHAFRDNGAKNGSGAGGTMLHRWLLDSALDLVGPSCQGHSKAFLICPGG